jgi:hypothetical protein
MTVSQACASEGGRGAGQSQPMSVHAHRPSRQLQVLQPSPAGFVCPGMHSAHAISVQAQRPSVVQVHVLQPSPAGFVCPGVQVGLQAMSVHPHWWSVPHVQVLQPSLAGFVSPGVQTHALAVQAHWFCMHVHVLQPSGDGLDSPFVHGVSQSLSVQPHLPSAPHVHVLQPSRAGDVAPMGAHASPLAAPPL